MVSLTTAEMLAAEGGRTAPWGARVQRGQPEWRGEWDAGRSRCCRVAGSLSKEGHKGVSGLPGRNGLCHALGNSRAEAETQSGLPCAASDVHPLVDGGDQGAAPARPGDPHSPGLSTRSRGAGAGGTPRWSGSCACCISCLEFSEKLSE